MKVWTLFSEVVNKYLAFCLVYYIFQENSDPVYNIATALTLQHFSNDW